MEDMIELKELMEPLELVEQKEAINGIDKLVGSHGNYKARGIEIV